MHLCDTNLITLHKKKMFSLYSFCVSNKYIIIKNASIEYKEQFSHEHFIAFLSYTNIFTILLFTFNKNHVSMFHTKLNVYMKHLKILQT